MYRAIGHDKLSKFLLKFKQNDVFPVWRFEVWRLVSCITHNNSTSRQTWVYMVINEYRGILFRVCKDMEQICVEDEQFCLKVPQVI